MTREAISIAHISTACTFFSLPLSDNTGTICEIPHHNIIKFLKKTLSEWEFDTKTKRYVISHRYYYIDYINKQLYLPIALLSEFIRYLDTYNIPHEITPIQPAKPFHKDFQLSEIMTPREDQLPPISFMTKDDVISAVELGCGSGKTFMSIVSLAKLKQRTLIIVPASLQIQWIANLERLLPTEQIYIIQGRDSIVKLLSSPELRGEDGPMVILASNKTLSQYAMNGKGYHDLATFEIFVKMMHFGVKIIDEIHLGFYMNVMIDLKSNIPKNIYLSATYKRTSQSSEKIFSRIFPAFSRFSEDKGNKHVNIVEVDYKVGGQPIDRYHTETPRGYSQFKYEKYVMMYPNRKEVIINYVFKPLIYDYFVKVRKPNQKLLIIVGLTDFAKFVAESVATIFHDFKVTEFLGGYDEQLLTENDIIVSTIGSMGTGKDVKGLKTMIVFSSIASEPQNLQLIGRLRKIPDETCEFLYLANRWVASHQRHCETRRKIFLGRAKTFKTKVL